MPKKQTKQEFIEKANEIHKNFYDYSLVEYINSSTKVKIICPVHGEFLQKPNSHISCHQGCPPCGIQKMKKLRITTHEFINRATIVHSSIYDYSQTVFNGSDTKVDIICPKHGIFSQRPYDHLNGSGCQTCKINRIIETHRLTTELFITKSKELHGSNRYTYEKTVYADYLQKLEINCPEHGYFWIKPSIHLNKRSRTGCPRCSIYGVIQHTWLNLIGLPDTKSTREITLTMNDKTWIFADGFDPVTNTIYEFWGDYWHGNPIIYNGNKRTYFGTTFGELYEKTLRKREKILSNGFNLVEIWENDFNWCLYLMEQGDIEEESKKLLFISNRNDSENPYYTAKCGRKFRDSYRAIQSQFNHNSINPLLLLTSHLY